MKFIACFVTISALIAVSSTASQWHPSPTEGIGPSVDSEGNEAATGNEKSLNKATTYEAINDILQSAGQLFNTAFWEIEAKAKFVKYVRCVISVIDKYAKNYEFAAMWEPVKQEVQEVLEQFQSCDDYECANEAIRICAWILGRFCNDLKDYICLYTYMSMMHEIHSRCAPYLDVHSASSTM